MHPFFSSPRARFSHIFQALTLHQQLKCRCSRNSVPNRRNPGLKNASLSFHITRKTGNKSLFALNYWMKEILFASGNRHKADEAKKIFSRSGIRIKWAKISLLEPDFESLKEISAHKAMDAYNKLGKPVIVEDTGVYFSAYKNFPGQYAKRMFLSLGFEGLLKLLEGKNRKAYFATTACYYDGKKLLCSTGKLYGKILESPEGEDKDV